MAAISATSYATPTAQAMQGRVRLEQARREADQAESFARQLRAEADQAEVDAQKGQQRVTALSVQVQQSQQADSTYTAQVQKQVPAKTSSASQQALASVATVASNGFSFPANPLRAYTRNAATGIFNGESSGRFVNQTA